MATTLMPVDPQTTPQRATRNLTIAANLLPDEIIAGRRARRARAAVIGALVAVLVLLSGWYMHGTFETRTAAREKADAEAQAITLKRQQAKYNEVVDVQAQTKTIADQLKTLMATDLPYATLLDTVRQTGTTSGVTVTGVSAKLAGADETKAKGTVSTNTAATIGTLQITGEADNKRIVAKYVDALSELKIVVNPFLTSLAATKKENGEVGVQFSLTADISTTAQCGRFTTPCKTTGGN
ncbi:PilN domain-containing protein [Krasilnikovia sp. M28-CT-15]|uniref:PilN domain-containing protein n=1 Tax=Krasilnikovia sp. M28-CT-15 TaxID=3373540 RepID=UPI003876A129